MIATFDHVIIIPGAAHVTGGVVGFGAFFEVVNAPINAVKVNVEVPRAGVRLSQSPLSVTAERVTTHRVETTAAITRFAEPSVVRTNTELEFTKLAGSFRAINGLTQFPFVVAREIHTQSVFLKWIIAAVTAADAQPGIDLKGRHT